MKLRTEMGRNALQRVERYYQQDEVIRNYRQIYLQLGGEQNGRDRI